jgi:pyruvate dehydrogenase E2 component (dihydrolipoamide acetyltransferase)
MPALGMQQDTGTLIAWLKTEGERVTKGEPVMEIETDKVTVEIEAPAAGILGGICAAEGDIVPVGQTVAWILAEGEKPPQEAGISQVAEAVDLVPHREQGEAVRHEHDKAPRGEQEGMIGREPRGSAGARLWPASPKARRMAREQGLRLESLMGSGPGGAVLAADVAAAGDLAIPLEQQGAIRREPEMGRRIAALPTGDDMVEVGSVWQVMAERVTQSWTTAPHFYLVREVNAGRLVAWRAGAQAGIEAKLTYSDLLIALVAAALRRHRRLNAAWHAGRIVQHHEINIGLAAAVDDGLLVPVIHQADELSLEEIAAQRQALIERAQAGRLKSEDILGGTFTISNLGMYGVDAFSAVVNPPQAAILAVGRIAERVVPIDGQPAVQRMMILSLSCDHRLVDGARGASFLDTLAALIEEPLLLLELNSTSSCH